ncbi:hypothetical protein FF1_008916 [Malus domestica]
MLQRSTERALLEMAAKGLEMKFDGYYTLLNECVNRKAKEKAKERMLDEMPERNVVSWTAMVSAYSKRGYASEL